ncbi:helix-turn-helix transcriptional regulator [Bradyrhizobium sp. ARR65]|uniref:helix-turn-helix domain-containing protein n=1 Tax=Bradyrhizobium sp. ARR65 TaxID=1040989 RepID=UPI000463D589|nr:helix-turn-helix transcriptional regulator [Bradyrhizobium sp. ARR65]
MSQQESRLAESDLAEAVASGPTLTALEAVRPQAMRAAAADEEGAIARQLNGSLTALLLYMGEIKQLSRALSQSPEDRAYLQKIVDHALQQTERVCALVKQVDTAQQGALPATNAKFEFEERVVRPREIGQARLACATEAGQRPLTKREREVLQLISEGHSNKQGALRMRISPRTFESHRAEAMRKLGARNTAELVRAALLLIGERTG